MYMLFFDKKREEKEKKIDVHNDNDRKINVK